MKRYINLITFCAFISCSYQQTDFSFQQATIHLSSSLNLSGPIDHHAELSCIYGNSCIVQMDGVLYSISLDSGKIEPMPKTVGETMYVMENDMYVRNDSLIIMTLGPEFEYPYTSPYYGQNEYNCLCFHEFYDSDRETWKVIRTDSLNVDDKYNFETILIDDDFIVKYSGRGEFGGYLLFLDKHTRKEHLFKAALTRLLKYHNDYYVIGPKSISIIDNPQYGMLNNHEVDHKFVVPATPVDPIPSCSNQGYDEIEFGAGWIVDDQIYLFCRDSNGVFVSKLEGDSIKREFDIGVNLHFSDWNSKYRMSLTGNSETVSLCCYSSENTSAAHVLIANGYEITYLVIE